MEKSNVYFCQFSNMLDNNIYLPYSIGIIISYLRADIEISNNYDFKMLYVKEDIDNILKKVIEPKYFFISVYMWNFKYSMQVAKEVKSKYPKCQIILGGHHVPYFDIGFFKKYPYIDLLVHGEGELVCKQILSNKCYLSIHNLSINKNNKEIRTKKEYNNCDLNLIPSAYLTGVFDEILQDGYNFTASLETNRGCPFGCKYCDWGSTLTSQKKMRKFDINRVIDEIEWLGKNQIDFVFGTDSNFGIFTRDMVFIDKLIEVKKKYGYPNKFRVCYTKNSDAFVYTINKKLNDFGLSKGATLSFQSLNSNTMKAVGRRNIDIYNFDLLLNKYKADNIPTYTEMILGLPEETYNSFADGLCTLLDSGQHSSIVVYYCQVYPNAYMNTKEYRKKYGLKTIKIPMYPTHTSIESDKNIDEEEIIIGTNTMSSEDWIETCMFSWAIQTFHCLGLCQVISKFLNEKFNISYRVFYESILMFAHNNPDSFIGEEYYKIRDKLEKVRNGEGFKYINRPFGNLNWTFEEGSFLSYIKNKDAFYLELYEAISDFGDYYKIANLIKVNKFLIKSPLSTITMFNNIYIKEILEFLNFKNTNSLTFHIKNNNFESLERYAIENVWYGRKGGNMLHNENHIKGEGVLVWNC